MARKFKLVIIAEDNEAEDQSVEAIKQTYIDDVLNDNGYGVTFSIESIEEIAPPSADIQEIQPKS